MHYFNRTSWSTWLTSLKAPKAEVKTVLSNLQKNESIDDD